MAHKMPFPDGFYAPYVDYQWLVHYYDCLRCLNYDLYPNFDEFVKDYLNPHSLIIQGPGIVIRLEGIDSKHMAKVHGFVFSKDVFKVVPKIRELVKVVMDGFFLLRLESEIPTEHRGVGRLLEKIGFTLDGHLRQRGKRGTIVYDTSMYSITRGD